jgi:catechol 2,3-dioxygenase-like lactoylglutathione lyase family enzyme
MLKDRNSSAIVAVSDLGRARHFYEEVLGLEPIADEGPGDDTVLGFRTGQTRLTVYQSEFAGTNKANAVTFEMQGDLAATVAALKAKGVVFEHYDLPGLTLDGDIHRAGEVGLVWLKDPDGNILHLIQGM